MRTKHLCSTASILIVVLLYIIFDNGTYAFQGLRTRYPISIYVSDPFPYTERRYLIFDNIDHGFMDTHYGIGVDELYTYTGKWHQSGDTIIVIPRLGFFQGDSSIVCDKFPYYDEYEEYTISPCFKYLIADSCLYSVSDRNELGWPREPSYLPYHLIHGMKIQDFGKKYKKNK